MTEMIERVAAAIYAVQPHLNTGKPVPWLELIGPLREKSIELARAAIEAMREPTEEMMDAGESADPTPERDTNAIRVWGRMIDAALTSPPAQT